MVLCRTSVTQAKQILSIGEGGNFPRPVPAITAHGLAPTSAPGVVQEWKSLLSSPGYFITPPPVLVYLAVQRCELPSPP